MSDNDNNTRTRKPLGLKRAVDAGEVKQTFSHGRTNKVAVEVKRKRKILKPGEAAPAPAPAPEPAAKAPAPAAAPQPAPAPVAKKPAPKRPAPSDETPQERVARLQREAEEDRLKLAEEARRREEEAKAKAIEEEKQRAEANREAEAEAEAKKAAEAEAAKAAEQEAPAAAETGEPPVEAEAETAPGDDGDGEAVPAPRKFTPVKRPEPKKPEKKPAADKKGGARDARGDTRNAEAKGADRRRGGKLTVNRALNDDEGARARSLAALKRAREKERRSQYRGQQQQREKQVRDVIVPEAITVQELANRMAEKGADLVKALFNMGMMVTVNQTIDQDTAELLVEEFGHNIERVSESDVDIDNTVDVDPEETLKPRPPVVTIMGHVDHGKTSLLDALRGTDVTRGEAGGITQHIGAYQIKTKAGDLITFLDTPGHEAFTEMRARGANVTDIVILVVAGDDGLMPQTIEAINHTKAAGVPMIVAINKIDKDEANPQKIRERLLEHEIIVEAMSGDVQDVEVSAKSGAGLDDLIEKILLQAELLELKANPDRAAEATVIEAKLDKGKGPLATVLVNRGTLKVGDIFVAGSEWGRVRAMVDAHGEQMNEAGPSMPVEVLGLNGTPDAGDEVVVVDSESRAREICEFRARRKRDALVNVAGRGSLEQMFEKIKEGEAQTLPVVLKGDVHGSVEAIANALNNMGTDEVRIQVLHAAVGGINESDVTLARASGAPIIAFNVRANPQARELAKRDGVDIRYYSIIYNLTDDMKNMLSGMLAPEVRETFLGYAEVKEVFSVSKIGKVAGCLVTEGQVKRGAAVRLIRDDVVIHQGELSQLKRFKDDVREVVSGTECGMAFANYQDIQVGDVIECFDVEKVARAL